MDIVIGSNNNNKIKEISAMIKNKKVRLLSLADIGFHRDIPETGETLSENALIKACAVKKFIKNRKCVILADDSGLEVDYLAKAPGVYSARFAGKNCSYSDNNKKLLKLLKGVKPIDRGAVFRTVIAIIFVDGSTQLVEGKVQGRISSSLKGKNGFGYDPVFVPAKCRSTYAQMAPETKNRLSHRKKAVRKAVKAVKNKVKSL